MAIRFLGIAALLASALRSAAPDVSGIERDEEQQRQIDANREALAAQAVEIRSRFDELTGTMTSLQERIQAGETLDASEAETLAAVVTELNGLADAFTGPVDNPDDNGLIDEVQAVDSAPTSDAVEEVIEAAIQEGVDVPEATAPVETTTTE